MKTLKELARYPSAIAGLIIIAGLVALAVYTMVTIPTAKPSGCGAAAVVYGMRILKMRSRSGLTGCAVKSCQKQSS
jgi:hypothetical protein